ncbi:MAG: ABC transporter permease, partial [Planctomycetota bacterium]
FSRIARRSRRPEMFHIRLFLTAIRSLRQNLVRSILATLGVIIGVGAVVAAVSILQGAQRDILDRFESLGADTVMVFNGSERRSHRGIQKSTLTPEDAQLIGHENSDVIIATAPQYTSGGQIKYFEKSVPGSILGTSEAYSSMNSYHVAEGRFITDEDSQGGTMICVLGHRIARELFGALPGVGKTVKINQKSFIVIGVMEEKGTLGFVEVDNQVIIPLSTAMDRMFGSKYLSLIVVQCVDSGRLPVCIDRSKKTLRASHRIKAGDEDDFTIFTQERIKQEFSQVAVIFAVVLYSIAGISVAVGAIGIMNIMLVSVTERTREIGVRMAVGARRMDIMKQFLTEASVISLFGGALGVLWGWAVANLLGEVTEVIETYTPPSIIVISLLMALVVGIVSGLYPAIRAAGLDPIQSLRYE